MGQEEILTTVADKLFKAGVTANLMAIAELTVDQRRGAYEWAVKKDRGPMPDYVKGLLAWKAPGAPELPSRSGPLALTKAENTPTPLESHANVPKTSVDKPVYLRKSPEENEGDEVRYTWGEEKITPVKDSYSTVTVGPFTYTTRARPGESLEQAHGRLVQEAVPLAEQERERKVQSFLDALVRVRKQVAGG
jgi:hypothetical protein